MNKNIQGSLELPHRPGKPRHYGLTSIMDLGIPLGTQRHILESYGSLLDIVKIGTAAAYINPVLERKIAVYAEYRIPVCLGGTLFEKHYQQGRLHDYGNYLKSLNVSWVEISSGVAAISHDEVLRIAQDFSQDFTVLVEVGKKFASISHEEWLADVQELVEADIPYVIMEGRGTGTAGIYDALGNLDKSLIETIEECFDIARILFEAPTKFTQIQLIELLGNNVNLANVLPRDLVGLEALRQGLRAETFDFYQDMIPPKLPGNVSDSDSPPCYAL